MTNQAIQTIVARSLNAQIALANVVNGFIIDHKRTIRVLQRRMRRQNRIVRLDDGSGHLGRGVNGKFELGLLAIVNRETLHKQRGEAGTSAAAERVKDQETLEPAAVVRQLADAIEHIVDDLLADRVVATGVVVRRILLARDQLLRVKETLVSALAN